MPRWLEALVARTAALSSAQQDQLKEVIRCYKIATDDHTGSTWFQDRMVDEHWIPKLCAPNHNEAVHALSRPLAKFKDNAAPERAAQGDGPADAEPDARHEAKEEDQDDEKDLQGEAGRRDGPLAHLGDTINRALINFQAERARRWIGRGSREDVLNLVIEELKKWVVEVLIYMRCDDQKELLLVQQRVDYIGRLIDRKDIFPAGWFANWRPETLHVLLAHIKSILENKVLPTIEDGIHSMRSREYLSKLKQEGQSACYHAYQFLFYAFRNTENTEAMVPLDQIVRGEKSCRKAIESDTGRMLRALVIQSSRVWPELKLGRWERHVAALPPDTQQFSFDLFGQGEQPATPAVADSDGKVAPPPPQLPVAHAQTVVPTASNPLLDDQFRSHVIRALRERGENSAGMLARYVPPMDCPTADPSALDTLDQFFRAHALVYLMALILKEVTSAHDIAGRGGDLLAFGVAQVHKLASWFKEICRQLQQSVQTMYAEHEDLYGRLSAKTMKKKDAGNRTRVWLSFHMHVEGSRNSLFEALERCRTQCEALESAAKTESIQRRALKAREETRQFNQRVVNLGRDLQNQLPGVIDLQGLDTVTHVTPGASATYKAVVVILGKPGCGRRSLRKSALHWQGSAQPPQGQLVELSSGSNKVVIDFKLVHDPSDNIPTTVFRGVSAVVVLYDVTDRDSLTVHAKRFVDSATRRCATGTVVALVGNKSDLDAEVKETDVESVFQLIAESKRVEGFHSEVSIQKDSTVHRMTQRLCDAIPCQGLPVHHAQQPKPPVPALRLPIISKKKPKRVW